MSVKHNRRTLLAVSVIIGTAITLSAWFVPYEPYVINLTPFSPIRVHRGFPVPWLAELLSPGPSLGLVLQRQTFLLGLVVDIVFWSAIAFVVLFLYSKIVKVSKPRKPPDEKSKEK